MAITNLYTQLGHYTVVPAADIADATAPVNVKSAGRLGDAGIGKHAGMRVLRLNGTDDYDVMIALGPLPTDKWILFEMGIAVTPS